MIFESFDPTQTQLRMLEGSDQVGNLCAVFKLHGDVDAKKLSFAVSEVVHHCAPFSYKFLRVENSLRIFTNSDSLDGLTIIDTDGRDDEAHAYSTIRTLNRRMFRLDGGAPYLFCLLRGKNLSFLVFVCHPALIDRFSLKPLFKKYF